jgi:hypothetical protein
MGVHAELKEGSTKPSKICSISGEGSIAERFVLHWQLNLGVCTIGFGDLNK